MSYTRRVSIPRQNEGALKYEIARAVFYAQKNLGATAWCKHIRYGVVETLGYDVYDMEFDTTNQSHHPLQAEQAIRDWIDAHQP